MVEHLGDAAGVLVVDETGFLEEGVQIGWSAAAVQRDGLRTARWGIPDLCHRPGTSPAGSGTVPAPGVG